MSICIKLAAILRNKMILSSLFFIPYRNNMLIILRQFQYMTMLAVFANKDRD